MTKTAHHMNFLHYASLACLLPLYYVGTWQHWMGVLLVYTLLQLGCTVGYHRLATHRGFKTNKFTEYLLITLGGLALQSSLLSWKSAHLNHHRHSDKEGDTHSPVHKGLLNCIFNLALVMDDFPKREKQKRVLMYCKHELKDSFYKFQHEYYFHIFYAVVFTLFCINYKWMLIYLSAAGISKLMMSMIASFSHRGGYPHEDNWLGVISFGEGWHTRHHHRPKDVVWGKYDLGGWVIGAIRNDNGDKQ